MWFFVVISLVVVGVNESMGQIPMSETASFFFFFFFFVCVCVMLLCCVVLCCVVLCCVVLYVWFFFLRREWVLFWISFVC